MANINELLLELVQRYKKALVYQNVYKTLLNTVAPQSAYPTLPSLVDEQALHLAPVFAATEEELAAGFDPKRLLEELLEKIAQERL